METNRTEMKRVFDEGTIVRSILESEVSMKKCRLYSELANDKDVRSFFQEQSDALDGVTRYLRSHLADLS
ncbi:hypothetical protein Sgly_1804 [Syntrophobotulus glycolicus DSM 8271]|uniref:Uncharacterized protein n=1 Tax=Syntrophobotulus glycolicus (strain DSM 8271 / FlGlyR) TaxID=645991 RepID=F0SZL5_SYNGF|nr:hypothetical protein [Syntrophobotulus glycolicus]ADY56101.1 hypothetical protein Sgly_1804 [Syntrophobotulus glycolicus DSM 8271]